MQILTLNAHQRLQLESLLGAQRGAAKDMFLLGAVIGKIRLTEDDKKRANCRPHVQNGQEYLVWNRQAAELIELKDVPLEDEEARRVEGALSGWTGFAPADEDWLRPILDRLGGRVETTLTPSRP